MMEFIRGIKEFVKDTNLIVFDLDQTLVDSLDRNTEAALSFLKAYGRQADEALVRYVMVHPPHSVAAELSKRTGHSMTAIQANEEYVRAYFSSHAPIRVMDGAIPLIRYFRKEGKLVAAMTAAGREIHDVNLAILQTCGEQDGIERVFHATHFTHPTHPRKDASAFYCLCDRIRISGAASSTAHAIVLVIGDSVTDKNLATNINANFIRVSAEYTVGEMYKELIQ